MCDQVAYWTIYPMEATVLLATNYLRNQYSKTINIRFCWELPICHILRWHVAAANTPHQFQLIRNSKLRSIMFHIISNKMLVTYNVPTTLPVLASVWFTLTFLANPKSAILGFISASKRILLALRSIKHIVELDTTRESCISCNTKHQQPFDQSSDLGQ